VPELYTLHFARPLPFVGAQHGAAGVPDLGLGAGVYDPYTGLATWYVRGVTGVDTATPGTDKQAAGYSYKTIDNALLDVFYVGNTGNRRIVVVSEGATFYPGGSQTYTRGSYFPAGGPDAAHPCVLQGDPNNATLPVIDAQLAHACYITGVSKGVTTTITFSNPISGPAVNPFVAGNLVTINPASSTNAPIVGMTQLSGLTGTVSSPGGSSGAWTVVLNIDSSGFSNYVSGGGIQYDGDGSCLCVGSKGGFTNASAPVANIVIRKLELINGTAVDFHNGTGATGVSSNVTIEYCSMHGQRYHWANPGSSGAIYFPNANQTSHITIQRCKFYDMGTRPGEVTTSGASNWSMNCVPFETYGSDYVTIQNCSFDNCYVGIRQKLFNNAIGAGGTGNGSNGGGTNDSMLIQNCVFSGNYQAFLQGTGSYWFASSNNFTFINNLIYGPHHPIGDAFAMNSNGAPNQAGSNVLIANNTIGEDTTIGVHYLGATGITVMNNIDLSTGAGTQYITPDPNDALFTATSADVFTTYDYNVYLQRAAWVLGFIQTNYNGATPPYSKYKYNTFAKWQAAWTTPLNEAGAGTSPTPPDLATIHDPDPHAIWIPNQSASWNTEVKNFPNYASRDYTIAPGSPLLTASSTGGRVGYDPTNIGPGW
jgi:hypothetical protein